jgi:uncharacterized cupin superfamily protein
MIDPRAQTGPFFCRRTAGEDILNAMDAWEVWVCDGPEFHHDYNQSVTLYVHAGKAVVNFVDGSQADLRAGDSLTIHKGARAIWDIETPIRNSYTYHAEP